MQVNEQEEPATGTYMPINTTLYNRYAHAIFAYVQLHVSSREDAEDVLLEVFMAAFEHNNLVALTEQEQLLWLRRVAKNKFANLYRYRKRHPAIDLEYVVETLYDDDARSPEAVLLRQERDQQLHATIHHLSQLQQQLLQLRFGYGLRFSEIALLLGKREATLRKLLSRTLTSLRSVSLLQE